MAKRIFDFIFSFVGLIILIPFLLLIAVVIVLSTGGPIFYMQERIGINGVPFKLYKFRTMFIDSDKSTAITVGTRNVRITPSGYFLRKFKLDELPQLINVLKGEMSLVGPRPELKKFTDLYTPEQKIVLSVKPGITDFASIQFRNENEMLSGKPDPIEFYITEIMPVKLNLNLEYVAKKNFWLDVKIIFLTLSSIFKG